MIIYHGMWLAKVIINFVKYQCKGLLHIKRSGHPTPPNTVKNSAVCLTAVMIDIKSFPYCNSSSVKLQVDFLSKLFRTGTRQGEFNYLGQDRINSGTKKQREWRCQEVTVFYFPFSSQCFWRC